MIGIGCRNTTTITIIGGSAVYLKREHSKSQMYQRIVNEEIFVRYRCIR